MPLLRLIIIQILGPIHGHLIRLIAYGPWGPLHRVFIGVFKWIYKIGWTETRQFKTLGDFFLRDIPIQLAPSPLVSPVEGFCFEGPKPISLTETLSAKGIEYSWKSFPEFEASKFRYGTYWNLYLAPQNYHWVHMPTKGLDLEGFRSRGACLPVNGFGRWLEPKLYAVNERLSFRFRTEDYGEVIVICVGAMGVSSLYCDRGVVDYGRWTRLSPQAQKGERLLAFRLGSTVIMLTEKPVSSSSAKTVLRVGDDLL